MRTFNANFEAEKNRRAQGPGPRNLLAIGFTTPVRLADQDLTISGVAHQGLVTEWGFVDSSAGQGPGRSLLGGFETSDLTLTLINSTAPRFSDYGSAVDPIEGAEVTLYQWYTPLALTEAEVMFKGVVTGQPDYNLAEYRLTVQGIWHKYNRLIGSDQILSELDWPDLDPDDIGKMGNIAYGVIDDAPCRALDAGAVDNLRADISAGAASLELSWPARFPNSGKVGIDEERITYTGKSGNYLTGCTRGVDGTTATTHGAGSAVWEIGNEFVYQIAGHPVKTITDLYVDDFRVTPLATFYTGQVGSQKPGYGAQAVAVLPARITRQMMIDLLVNDGIAINDAIAVLDTIGVSDTISVVDGIIVVDGITVSDTIAVADTIGVATGSHAHAGASTATLIPTSSAFVNDQDNPWAGAVSNVRDQSEATSVYTSPYHIGDGPEIARCQASFAAYTGSTPSAVYLCVRHKSYTANQSNGSVKVDGNTVFYAADLTTYGTMQPVTQKFYYGTTVPTAFTVDLSSDNNQQVYCTVFEMWLEVHASNTGSSAATGVAKTGAAAKSGAAAKTGTAAKSGAASKAGLAAKSGAAAKGGTVTRSGAVTLSGNSVADVEIGRVVSADFEGWRDDGAGSITGVAYALIERPGHVYKHLLTYYCGFPSAAIGASFAAAQTFYAANGYAFSLLLNQPVLAGELFSRLDLQCRSRFLVTPAGEARLLVRQLGQASAHSIPMREMVRGSFGIMRSFSADIVNSFNVLYDRTWRQSGPEAYRKVTAFGDAVSVARYGPREPSSAELFYFDAVGDGAMAEHVGAFWLEHQKGARRLVRFSVFLDNSEIEPGDLLDLGHPLDHLLGLVCEVLKVRYVLGSARDQRMDTLEVLAVENRAEILAAEFQSLWGVGGSAGQRAAMVRTGAAMLPALTGSGPSSGQLATMVFTGGEFSVLTGSGPSSGQLAAMVRVGPELITNGDFETGDLTGWQFTGTAEASTEQVRAGAYSCKFTGRDGYADMLEQPAAQYFTTETGHDYELNLWVYSALSSIKIGAVHGSGWPDWSYGSHGITPNVWSLVTIPLTETDGGGDATIFVEAPYSGGLYYLDDISMTEVF